MTTAEGVRVGLPDAPRELARRRMGAGTIVKFFGPGAIIASITVGSGETVLASRLGAVFGLGVLWLVVVGAVAKGAIVYASNRYIVLTGEHAMRGLARVVPGPRGWFPALVGLLAILSFPFVASALATGLGDYLESVVGGPSLGWGLGLLLLAAALAWFGWYALLERAQIAIVALMISVVVVAAFAAEPAWLDVLAGFVPQDVGYAGWVAGRYPEVAERSVWVEAVVFLGGLGGGMYDYIGYAAFMREKRWGMTARDEDPAQTRAAPVALEDTPEERRLARQWSRAPLGDVVLSFAAMAVIAMAFVITGATILASRRNVPEGNDVLTFQGDVLATVAPVLGSFYVVAIIAVFFGTMYAIWDVYSRTTYESLAAVSDRVRVGGLSRVRRWVYVYILLAGVLLVVSEADLVDLITPANIVGGTLACGLYGLGLLLLERRVLPPGLRIGALGQALVAAGGLLLLVSGAVALLSYLEVVG